MKKLTILFSAILLFLAMIGFGLYGFSKIIYNSCDCERFTIDNIELRTGINIPSIKKTDCLYNEKTKTKNITFVLDTKNIDFEDYIKKNDFRETKANAILTKSNNLKNHKYKAILDKKLEVLEIEITYKN